jgi:ABC-type branched-subunit amino acid transport system substrate-binding protein
VIATERFARSDTSVTAQALKLVAANPDAMLIVASGSGAAMPHMGVVERGYKGKIYQTHAAATRDLMRVGGKDVEGAFVVSGPAVIAEQLPDNHPSKKEAIEFVQQYEKAYGPARATSLPATVTTPCWCWKKPCRWRSRRPNPARPSSAPRCATPLKPWAARCWRTAC